jgi:hypothetical protein
MLLDQQALFSEAQAITATAASTNVIDTGSSKDVGKYGDIPLLIQVVEAFNTLTSLTVTVQTDDNSSFSSNRRDLHGHSSGIPDRWLQNAGHHAADEAGALHPP